MHFLIFPIVFWSAILIGSASLVHAQSASPTPSQQTQQAAKPPLPKGPIVVNRIAATVNGRPITSNEVSFRLMPIFVQLATQYPRQGSEFQRQLTIAKKAIINELIERELVLSDFKSKGAYIKESIIDQEIARIIRETYNGNRDRFMEYLRDSGMTIRKFRETTRRNVTVMAMRSTKYDQHIPPTPDEINKEYQESKLKFRDITKDRIQFKKIFIPIHGEDAESTPEVQLELAELVKEEIEKGNLSFEEAAKRYSKDAMAAQGGKWQEIERSSLSPEFAAIIFEAPEQKIVGPLIEPNGFTIVCVLNKKLASPPPLSKIKDAIDAQVRSKRSVERYKQWIERLRSKAIIKTYI